MRKLPIIVPLVYILGSVIVWIDFAHTPPDGLANVGLALYTFPVMLIGMLVMSKEFPFVDGDYYHAHAVYFAVSVALLSTVLYFMLRYARGFMERRRERGNTQSSK